MKMPALPRGKTGDDMIAFFAALLGATTSACLPVPGADRLWQPQTRWVIVGEMHGTNETPDAFANLACLAAATGRPVTVALEYPADGQAVIDSYLASNGDGSARAALMGLYPFASQAQDGRGSVAFLRLWDRLRRLKQAGQIARVIASDVGSATPPGADRNATMAQNWTAIAAPNNGIVLALVGNFHAIRKPLVSPTRTTTPAGALMPADRTITVNVVGNGGLAWNCRNDGCKDHDNGPSRSAAQGIVYSADADRSWDATYELGTPTTAARPALEAVATATAAGKSRNEADPPQ
jgi:hypothetical protein